MDVQTLFYIVGTIFMVVVLLIVLFWVLLLFFLRKKILMLFRIIKKPSDTVKVLGEDIVLKTIKKLKENLRS